MNAYVALLRGINVGGKTQIEMTQLKAVFEALDLQSVSSYINSGNVLFLSNTDPKTLKSLIEAKIQDRFGYFVPVILRDAQTIQRLCDAFPKDWKNDENQKTDILFLDHDMTGETALSQIRFNPEVDHLIAVSNNIGWSVDRQNYAKSGMKKFIGTPVYKAMTARNINTLRKLNALLNALQSTSS